MYAPHEALEILYESFAVTCALSIPPAVFGETSVNQLLWAGTVSASAIKIPPRSTTIIHIFAHRHIYCCGLHLTLHPAPHPSERARLKLTNTKYKKSIYHLPRSYTVALHNVQHYFLCTVISLIICDRVTRIITLIIIIIIIRVDTTSHMYIFLYLDI